ncbi:MAG: hypothetical protein QOE18_605, partial [Chloroflexota bacterium]|nr:hypothetical protein [Chloroflexota bacterium]
VATFIVIKLVSLVVPLRMTDKELEVGDLVLHGEVAIDMEPSEASNGVVPHGDLTPVGAGRLV